MVNICVIALIGLPGAGKTTFCKNIVECPSEYNVIHICYDEIFNYRPENNESTFKIERRKVIKKIEQIIGEMKSNTQQDKKDPNSNSLSFSVILVDDNNYYAGMRYEIYKVCKANQLSFGQVYFPVDLDCALARNATRGSNALPSYVIAKMNSRLESPSNKNQWERNTLVIHSIVDIEKFWEFLKTSFLNPLKCTHENNNCPVKVSLVHEIDICLRKRIKELLQNTEENISEMAKILNSKRKCILLDIQNMKEFDDTYNYNVQSICERLTS